MSRRPYWKMIERTYKAGLDWRAATLLRYLIHRADFKTGECSPGYRRILMDTGLTTRGFAQARETLLNAGHLSWVFKRLAHKENDLTEYRLAKQWVVVNDNQGGGSNRRQKHTTAKLQSRTTTGHIQCARCSKNIATDTTAINEFCRQCWKELNTRVLDGGQ